jgi:hypothetical protein
MRTGLCRVEPGLRHTASPDVGKSLVRLETNGRSTGKFRPERPLPAARDAAQAEKLRTPGSSEANPGKSHPAPVRGIWLVVEAVGREAVPGTNLPITGKNTGEIAKLRPRRGRELRLTQ